MHLAAWCSEKIKIIQNNIRFRSAKYKTSNDHRINQLPIRMDIEKITARVIKLLRTRLISDIHCQLIIETVDLPANDPTLM